MPNLGSLALRYVVWLIGLRVVYSVLVQVTGLPNMPSIGVILAALPAVDVARVAARDATRDLVFSDWAKVWGLCTALFLALQIIVPAILFAQMRGALAVPEHLQTTAILGVSTAVMLALFTWIGARMSPPRG